MRTALLIVMALAPAAPASASAFCESAWVARNAMFHRAGHCFSGRLGQELFGNAGCAGTNPALSAADAAAVARTREIEAMAGCRIVTPRSPSAAMRAEAARLARLRDIPAPEEGGWACLGYRGPGLALRSGASADSPMTGTVGSGAFVWSEHQGRGDWTFFTASDGPNRPILVEGWTREGIRPGECDQEAG